MSKPTKHNTSGFSLKEGPVIYQREESLEDDERLKKDLTLAELNHVFKLYLGKLGHPHQRYLHPWSVFSDFQR